LLETAVPAMFSSSKMQGIQLPVIKAPIEKDESSEYKRNLFQFHVFYGDISLVSRE
jgi:hypothetical protein